MSLTRISEILKEGDMINISLISEDLRTTLLEICDILTLQSEKIASLESDIASKVTSTDITSYQTELEEKMKSFCQEMEKERRDQKERLEEVYSRISKVQDSLEDSFEDTKQKILEDADLREKEVSGNMFILNQQVREINVKILGQQNLISKCQNEINKINKIIDSGKDKSIELLSVRLEAVEGRFQQFNSDFIEQNNQLRKSIDEIKEIYGTLKDESGIEFHTINVELKSIRQLIVDTPEVTFESDNIDTGAIIRAVQRDTKRIDAFNETLNRLKDEFVDLKTVFTKLNRTFNDFQTGVQDLVQDHNLVKKELFSKVADSVDASIEITRDVEKLNENLQFSVNSGFSMISEVQSMFLQFVSHVTSLTHKPFPYNYKFNDRVTDLQKQNDDSLAFQERVQQIIRNCESIKQFSSVSVSPFKIPVYQIQSPSPLSSSLKNSFFLNSEKQHMANGITSIVCQVDNATRNNVATLQKDVNENSKNVKELKENISTEINKKVDIHTFERYLERLKDSIIKVNKKTNEIKSQLGIYVQYDELENILQIKRSDLLEKFNSHRSCATPLSIRNQSVKQSKSVVPKIGGNAHIVLYGNIPNTQRRM